MQCKTGSNGRDSTHLGRPGGPFDGWFPGFHRLCDPDLALRPRKFGVGSWGQDRSNRAERPSSRTNGERSLEVSTDLNVKRTR